MFTASNQIKKKLKVNIISLDVKLNANKLDRYWD